MRAPLAERTVPCCQTNQHTSADSERTSGAVRLPCWLAITADSRSSNQQRGGVRQAKRDGRNRRGAALMAVVDLFSGYNKLMDGLQVEPDEKPWYG